MAQRHTISPMKKFLFSLFGILITFPSIAFAFEYTYEGQTLKYTILSEEAKTCQVSLNSVSGQLVIPSTAKSENTEYSVVAIGFRAFYGCSDLTSVSIPNTITVIEHDAFNRCSGLTSITIPNSVTKIDENAFWDCSSLTSVTIPNSVTMIGAHAFWGCSSMENLYFNAENCQYCGYLSCPAFPSSLKELHFGNEVKIIPMEAFCKCSSLTSISIPNSVTTIGHAAFFGCTSLETVSLDCDNIGTWFQENPSIKTLILGDNVKTIGSMAFYKCTGLTDVNIPHSVTTIASSAFQGCTSLISVTIGDSVTEIGNSAFRECNKLSSITIPNSVTEIGHDAFCKCTGLTSVIYIVEDPLMFYADIFSNEVYRNATLYYLATCEDKIASIWPWSLFVNRVGRNADPDDAIPEVRNIEANATVVYNTQGVNVGESTEGLPKGIYIVRQGKKVAKVAI